MLFRRIIIFLVLLALFLVVYYYLQPLKTGTGTDKFSRCEPGKRPACIAKDFILGNPTGIGIDTIKIFSFFTGPVENGPYWRDSRMTKKGAFMWGHSWQPDTEV